MRAASGALGVGFLDPAMDSSRVFRSIMNAIAWPGRIKKIATRSEAPAPLTRATSDVLLTLVDVDTPVWLDGGASTQDVRSYLRFHTGCPIVDEPVAAAFGVVCDPSALPSLSVFSQGTPEYPDRSATIIIQSDELSNSEGVIFRGPGIADEQMFSASGMSDSTWADIQKNHLGFPTGVDVIFTGPDCVAACPRSVNVTVKELV